MAAGNSWLLIPRTCQPCRLCLGVQVQIRIELARPLEERRRPGNVAALGQLKVAAPALAAGYAGATSAIVAALGTLGISLTSLGLVAGALPVGIGFGLRALVENFVAGLLLLIERPIKVGDRIVIGGHQGTVKQISVRPTEIETLDRAAVICSTRS